ncbi:MAG TPA: BamA/TamA family outer membrane protein [Polyangiaceae bacterium]|jgi:hypothetical protein|nr:BamA/TamA family outer membrane protein [Polyangiaceae bacterium]
MKAAGAWLKQVSHASRGRRRHDVRQRVPERLVRMLGLTLILESGAARAGSSLATATAARNDELPPRRYEFLPVPNIGGNRDIGVELGVAFTLARFHEEERPYSWLLAGVFGTSFKDDENGFRAVQQFHFLRLDLPNLFSGRVRIDSRLNFLHSIDSPYYGVGNASTAERLPPSPEPTRQNEYVAEEVRLRSLASIKTGTLFDAAFAINLRYELPQTYQGSQLVADAARTGIAGTEHTFLSTIAAGVILDTRDNEFVPRRGVFYQLGVAGTAGSAERVAYGEAAGIFSSYLPIAHAITFATRVITSFQFGRVPFYDLQQTNLFNPQYLVGGDRGVRGVRLGRYAGHIKVLANYELRTTFIPHFRVAAWQLQVGTTTFLDAGRVWSDYDTPALDGTSLGVKYGVGGGFFFQWDRSSVFRVEAAYSPDNHYSGLPLGFYLANGLIF